MGLGVAIRAITVISVFCGSAYTAFLLGVSIADGLFSGFEFWSKIGSFAGWLIFPSSLLIHLVAIFGFAPMILRFVLRPTQERGGELYTLAQESFRKAGLELDCLWLVRGARAHNAMVSGVGRYQALFATDNLREKLSDDELRSVFLHEASHLVLGHLGKRLRYVVGILFSSLALQIGIILGIALLVPAGLTELALLIGFCGTLMMQTRLLHSFSRRQELEADHHAVSVLGASYDALCSALTQLDALNDAKAGKTHPLAFDRIQALAQQQRRPAA